MGCIEFVDAFDACWICGSCLHFLEVIVALFEVHQRHRCIINFRIFAVPGRHSRCSGARWGFWRRHFTWRVSWRDWSSRWSGSRGVAIVVPNTPSIIIIRNRNHVRIGRSMGRCENDVGCAGMARRCSGAAVVSWTVHCIGRRTMAGGMSMSWNGAMPWR